MKLSTLFSAAMLVAAAASTQAAVVDFTGETTGGKANGYTVGGIAFTDTLGANLSVGDFGVQSHGNALAVSGDDASKLAMSFATATSLSMEFGNDDPRFSSAGDRAWLQAYLGSTLVGTSFVTMNRDDIMNQTISISGVGTFDNAVFFYGNAAGGTINLVEIVDNINVTGAVPEPETYALMLAGLGVVGFVARRRKA